MRNKIMKKTFMLLLLCLCSFVFAAEVYEVEFNHNRQKFIVQNQSSAVAEITHWIIADCASPLGWTTFY